MTSSVFSEQIKKVKEADNQYKNIFSKMIICESNYINSPLK